MEGLYMVKVHPSYCYGWKYNIYATTKKLSLLKLFDKEAKNLKYLTDNNWKLKPACKMHQT